MAYMYPMYLVKATDINLNVQVDCWKIMVDRIFIDL